jgi:hypothetical protein
MAVLALLFNGNSMQRHALDSHDEDEQASSQIHRGVENFAP